MPSSRTVVVDRHAWLWWAGESPELGRRARSALDAADEVVVPAISLWEVGMMAERGRVRLDREAREWMRQALAMPRVANAPVSPERSPSTLWRSAGRAFPPIPPTADLRHREGARRRARERRRAIRAFERGLAPRAGRHLVW
jgi:hypothetical protein